MGNPVLARKMDMALLWAEKVEVTARVARSSFRRRLRPLFPVAKMMTLVVERVSLSEGSG
jgi:hypothetical protein